MTGDPVRVALVEPYLGGSHRAWAKGWQEASRHAVAIHGHAGTSWRWRMRGSAVTLSEAIVADAAEHGAPDVIMATDMVDLAGLLGLARDSLDGAPAVLYLHENQLTYPRQVDEALDHGLAWSLWRSMVAADEIWFNSAFHRDELLRALPAFLSSVPDHDHTHLLDSVAARSRVQPVGIDANRLLAADSGRSRQSAPLVLSNQRWHHDKDLGAVVRALQRAADAGMDFRLAIVGDDAGGQADELNPMIDRLGTRVVARGIQAREDYEELLRAADIVVSAASNEFFGIAVAEAVASGAWPIVPDGLAYREVVPGRFHEVCLYEPGRLGTSLRAAIETHGAGAAPIAGLAETMTRFDWSVIGAQYDDAIDELVTGGSRRAH